MSFIQNLFTSRDNNAQGNTYVGQEGRIWWDPDRNALYYSDGTTPGGIPVGSGGTGPGVPGGPTNSIQYNLGGGSFGGTANLIISGTGLSAVGNITAAYFVGDGSLLTNLPLANNTSNISGNNIVITGNGTFANISVTSTANLGNLIIYDQTIAGTINGRDINLIPLGEGNVNIADGFNIHATGNLETIPVFAVENTGKVTMLISDVANSTGAVEIIGSTIGVSVTQGNPGVILHLTGADGVPSRMYIDGVNNYPVYIGRRYNGTSSSPTGVLQNQVINRIGANPYLTDVSNFTSGGVAQINFIATEDQTSTAQGSRITMNVTPTGSNVQAQVASFDTSGIVLTGNLIPITDNIYSLGNVTNRWIGAYFGNAGIYIQDTTLGTTGSMSLDNGQIIFDDNINSIQVGSGNAIQLYTGGIAVTNGALDIDLGTVGDTGNTHILNAGIKFNDGTVQTTAAIPLNYIGNAFGVVPLNSSTKIDPIYLPSGAITFKGIWDAANNTPTLADGIGVNGDEYIVGVAGTQNLGSGNITFAVGDFALYTSANVWVNIPVGGSGVQTFNGRSGIVTLNNGDVINALSNGSITNNFLANSNITINTGTGLSGGGPVALGGTLTLTATGILNVIGGTGVTVVTSGSNATVSIGQAVGTANSVLFQAITSNSTVQATGNVTGGNIATNGRVIATGNIETLGFFKTPTTTINSGISTVGNITGGNLVGQNLTPTRVTFVGSGKEINDDAEFTYNDTTNTLSVGNITATGNISTSGFFVGDGGFISNITAVAGTKIVNGTSYANIATSGGNLVIAIAGGTVGTISTGGANITGYANVSGNVSGGNLVGQNLTPTRVTFVGSGREIDDDAEFTYNDTTNTLSVGNITATGNVNAAFFNGNGVGLTGTVGGSRYFGSFLSTVTQTNTSAGNALPMTFDTADAWNSGVQLGSPTPNSRVIINNPGVYNIQFSAQLDKTDAGADTVDIWLSQDGVNVPNTNTTVTLTGNDDKAVAAWNFLVQTTTANSYFELYWTSIDTQLRILAQGTQINPTRPATPSVILTVTQA